MSMRLFNFILRRKKKLLIFSIIIGGSFIAGGVYIYYTTQERMFDYIFTMLELLSVFLGIFFGFEYEKIRRLMKLENEVSNISPLLEIEILTNLKILKNLAREKDITLFEDQLLDISYWELYKDILRDWAPANTLRLKEIYGLSSMLNEEIINYMPRNVSKIRHKVIELIDLIGYYYDEVNEWFEKERAPPMFPRRAIKTLKIYEELKIEKYSEVIKERIEYFEKLIEEHSKYYYKVERE